MIAIKGNVRVPNPPAPVALSPNHLYIHSNLAVRSENHKGLAIEGSAVGCRGFAVVMVLLRGGLVDSFSCLFVTSDQICWPDRSQPCLGQLAYHDHWKGLCLSRLHGYLFPCCSTLYYDALGLDF